jgi:hypothetical protein
VGKYGTTRQATDDSIVRRMRIACWIAKVSDTHWEYVILISFQWQQWLRERSSIYCIRTLPLLFLLLFVGNEEYGVRAFSAAGFHNFSKNLGTTSKF